LNDNRRIQLLGERRDDAHAQSLRLLKIEVRGETGAFISHRNDE
jgi:hypothetical protein